jgi:hypothetical protein
LVVRVSGPRKNPLQREVAITVGSARLLIEPAKEKSVAGLLFPADPRKQRLGIILKDPPVILRWTGDKPPVHLPLDALFGEPGDLKRPPISRYLKDLKNQKWTDDEVEGRKAKRTTFESHLRKVTLWVDLEMKVPLKVIRETARARIKEEITLKGLTPLAAHEADRHIANFLKGREVWDAEEWLSPDRVRGLLEVERIPVTSGPLPANRIKLFRAGPRRLVRVFYGGRGLPHFFAAELIHGDVPAFSPDSPHPPVFSGPAGRWKVRIWTNLPPDLAKRQIPAYLEVLGSLAP